MWEKWRGQRTRCVGWGVTIVKYAFIELFLFSFLVSVYRHCARARLEISLWTWL